MNKYDFKNIIKRIIVGVAIAFLVMSIRQCKVSALVYKTPTSWVAWNSRSNNGTINSGAYSSVPFTLSQNQTLNSDYDLLGIQLTYFDFRYSDNITINGTGAYCEKYQVDNTLSSNPPEHVYTYMRCIETTGSTTGTGTLNNQGDIYSVYAIINDSAGGNYPCFFSSDMDGYIFCPTKRDNGSAIDMTGITFYVRNHALSVLSYYIELDNIKAYYNYDSTEIVEGLGGIQNQQQQTNTIISDSNVSGANTATNSAISGIENSVDDTLDNAISPNALNSLLTGFVNQLSNTTCTPITLPIPYTSENIVLPCLGTEFSQRIPVIWSLYELIITGVIVLRFWQHAVEFVLNILDPYHIGANNVPTGGGK